jgi:aminopeptidase N
MHVWGTARMILLSDYRIPDYLVSKVDILIALDATATRVKVTTTFFPNPGRLPGVLPLHLDGDELALLSIRLDGAAMPADAYLALPDKLTLHTPPQTSFTLEIETLINPMANSKLMGLYRSSGVYCTQCEADGFRRISYFPDRPDVMAVYRVRLEAEKAEAPVLLANGNLSEHGDIPGTTRHYAIWDDPHPKPCYLFAVVGGDLGSIHDDYITSEGRKVALGIYVEKGKEAQAHYAMEALKRSMRWDEQVFGRAYDLDVFNIVAVSDFNMGAMENKGLNIFNDKYVLASAETATDTDYALIEAIIAHEYFHNWTGNRITCRDWFQLCLKEGLTVFRDQEFSSDMRSRAVKRIMDAKELRARQFPEDAGPLAHPVRPTAYREINNFYTATVYEKGAEVIRMLKLLIGSEAFRKGMDLYFTRHDGDAATIEQFIACFAQTSGRDLGPFSRWYDQAGTPTVTVTRRHDANTGELTLTLKQATPPTPGQTVKEPQVIPVALGFVEAGKSDGKSVPDRVIILDTAEKTVRFPGVAPGTVPSLFRGFSAPVNADLDLTDAELLTLAQHDTDPFNRWQSLQTLAVRLLRASTNAVRNGQPALAHDGLAHDGLAKAFRLHLTEGAADPHFAALALGLPGEQDMAREIGSDVDPDAIHRARKTLKQAIARSVHAAALQTFGQMADNGPYTPDAAASGRRALRNVALDLIAAGDGEHGSALVMTQFKNASNMTDRFAALAILAQAGGPPLDEALALFELRFRDNPLVMDKWFALQSTVPDKGALDRVRSLLRHPAFSLSNPNRTRALIGGFALSNPTQFNRADGEGYAFAAEMILLIDQKNPQVAARIMTAFRSWRTLESGRQAKARSILAGMAKQSALSRDLSDIVDRTLS